MRPYSYASGYDVDLPDTTFATAESYAYTPATGLVERSGGKATLLGPDAAGYQTRLHVPVPDGWAVWSSPGRLCPALTLAASPSAPLEPCQAAVPEPGTLHLHAGLPTRGLGPLNVLQEVREGSAVRLFGATLFFGPPDPTCRAEPATVSGALAALRFTCDIGASVRPLGPGGESDARRSVGLSGPWAHVIRAVVLQLEGLGPYAVLVVAAEGEGAAADALLDQTVQESEAKRQAPALHSPPR